MKQDDLRRKNTAAILYSVINGNDTSYKISSDTGISVVKVNELVKHLVKNGFVTCLTEKEEHKGRRNIHYSVSDKYHAMYIEENKKSFSVISISPNGKVVMRLESMIKRKKDIGFNIENLISKFKAAPEARYCTSVFINCFPESEPLMPQKYIRSDGENIIASALASKDEIVLFHIRKKVLLSIYGHLRKIEPYEEPLVDLLAPDRMVFVNEEDFYIILCDALSKIAEQDLLKLVN